MSSEEVAFSRKLLTSAGDIMKHSPWSAIGEQHGWEEDGVEVDI
jgi:hypothetical protein